MRRARSTHCRALLAAAAAGLAALSARPSNAQDRPPLNGSWSASGLAERWNIGDWGEACGPKPAPQGASGGAVQISERGSELSIVGAGRAWSTAECWEQMPGLSRTSHSASGGGRFWRTRCSSAPNDPRQATVTTTVQATDTTISMTETGQYQFVIQDTNCTASVARARTFSLIRREGEVPLASSASASVAPSATAAPPQSTAVRAPQPEPRPGRCTDGGGEPARLEVRPGRKLMRPGERFVFRATVLDANGCPVASPPTWTIASGVLSASASVDPSGAVSIADGAPEGRLDAIVSIRGKGVTIPIEVASAEHYAALLATSGLDDAGEADAPAVAILAAGTIGGRTAVAEDLAKGRKQTFVAIVGGLAVLFGLVGFSLLRRGRTDRRKTIAILDDLDAEPRRDSLPEPDDASDGTPPPEGLAPSRPELAGGRREAAPAALDPAQAAQLRGKICPTCGQRFPSEAAFCGKDGTVLVLIN